ncbi:two-component system sensor histidine kinase NtrB [Bacillus suaedaesalsae]|uniref:histidine kinase n=1 Tax=Bacillus suaedaesalsae TaxID=2810349 RepID=A0ABS2DJY1_9BACI|nr:ATP-binding protein [Bacillus suaedaesalsae]MBM6618801.1 PAS domain-containing protein [Bacillus suaedaesalsae]
MKETYINVDSKTAQLEQELQVYRELLAHLPFSFSYTDNNRGLKITKERGKQLPMTERTVIEEHASPTFTTDFSLEKDVAFDEIEKILSPIFDTVPHHIVMIDENGHITLCNEKAATDFNKDRDSLIGKHIRELLSIPDNLILLLETLHTGQPIINREVLDSNYGINNTRIFRDSTGKIIRVLGAFQFLNKVKDSEKQAVAGRIAAGIAHEIRNPLTTVRGYLQFLSDKFSPDISSLVSSLLIPELDRANKIITDFLALAKPSDTKFELFNANNYICENVGKFLKSEAFLYDVDVEFECDKQVDDVLVSINSSEMLQVFINLFRNSFEAKGTDRLHIKLETSLLEKHVQIAFIDNGTGISPKALEHLFDPFFTTKDEGTGLGLSVSRKIVENHGGILTVRSSHKGTTFYIQLPALHQSKI